MDDLTRVHINKIAFNHLIDNFDEAVEEKEVEEKEEEESVSAGVLEECVSARVLENFSPSPPLEYPTDKVSQLFK